MTSTMMRVGMFKRRRVSPFQFLMLLQLKEGPRYGYEMLKALKEQFKGVWEPKTGTIYPALRSLEARDFVKTDVRDNKDFYSLTEKGEELLKLIGERLEKDLKFADRYYSFVTRWMPRTMKGRIMEMLRTLADEDVWPPLYIEHFIDEKMDQNTKLEVLQSLRKLLEKRLRAVEGMMEDIKGGGEI